MKRFVKLYVNYTSTEKNLLEDLHRSFIISIYVNLKRQSYIHKF